VIAAREPRQRPLHARLLHVDSRGRFTHAARGRWTDALRRADVVVANDAGTLPASLFAVHVESGSPIEVRLAGSRMLDVADKPRFAAVLFGAGDWRTRTEDRSPPPRIVAGDRIRTPSLAATIERTLGHPRLVELRFDASAAQFWRGLARDGRPVQYSHVAVPLALWDVWTPIAARPVAFEPPSAGFSLDWRSIGAMRARGVRFATLTHAAGLSSTGDSALDARLPLAEPYAIPASTALAIRRARDAGGRVVAVGTTVVRALEHAASRDGVVRAGAGLADQRIGPGTKLAVVDAILTGTHEAGTSHHDLLRAFVDADTLRAIDAEVDARGYRTHEFGDSMLVARAPRAWARCPVSFGDRVTAH
jgi:S-adenosylmethionine:tRNA ribosyltransferase-isomerase